MAHNRSKSDSRKSRILLRAPVFSTAGFTLHKCSRALVGNNSLTIQLGAFGSAAAYNRGQLPLERDPLAGFFRDSMAAVGRDRRPGAQTCRMEGQ